MEWIPAQVSEDKTEHSNPLYLVQVYKCIRVNLEDCKAGAQQAISRWCGPSVHPHVVSRAFSQENLVHLDSDAFFRPQISYVLQTEFLLHVLSVRQQIARNLRLIVHVVAARTIIASYL